MAKLGDKVFRIRSKNAGPFWITIDIFCGDKDIYANLAGTLSTEQVANVLNVSAGKIKRFNIDSLNVIKFSLPRPVIQGSRFDRDMHGAQMAVLVAELELE